VWRRHHQAVGTPRGQQSDQVGLVEVRMQDVDAVGNDVAPQLTHGGEIHSAVTADHDRFESPALRHAAQWHVIVFTVVDRADDGLDTPGVQVRNE
jgi:hypothetical protein